jgi:hypothetical protein
MLSRVTSMPPVYLLLWAGSLTLSIVLVALLRTRWGQSRPLHKCAVLSLLVHLMLAWAAMTVRMVAGDGRGDSGPPIRVRIVHETENVMLLTNDGGSPAVATPPLLEPPKEDAETPPENQAIAPQTEPSEPVTATEPAEPVEPTDVAIAADAAPVAIQPVAKDINPSREIADLAADLSANAESEPREDMTLSETPVERREAAPPPSSPSDQSESVVSNPPTPYALRTAPGRLGLVERQGGNAQTEAAVAAALGWLAAVQSSDGRWDANKYGAGQEQTVLGHDRGGAGKGADTGISALALLAFLGAGHSHLSGEYQDTVRGGLDFLLRSQAADGSLFGNATLYAQMYCHSMATFALAEAQAMTGDRRLEGAVGNAVRFCLSAQNATTGGWRYRTGDSGDTSQLGWQLMALASAERAGIEVPSHSWVRVERFLRSVRRGKYGGLASYRPDSGPSTSMTAEALYCRLLLMETVDVPVDPAADREAAGQLLTALPAAERLNLYYWYYATLALHHRQLQSDRAARDWQIWNDALTAGLLSTQIASGKDAGSWPTETVWGGYGGRVYTTAMAAMCLEVYYRYTAPPALGTRWTAARPEPAHNSR